MNPNEIRKQRLALSCMLLNRRPTVRARLVTLEYVREHPAATGRRGRMSVVLELRDKAFGAASEEFDQEQQ